MKDAPEITNYRLTSGRSVTLPLRYRNWQWMMATFTVPTRQAQELLPRKLKPILLVPGKAMVSFGLLQYPDVQGVAPYDEFCISIPVQYDPVINIPFLALLWNPLFPQPVFRHGASWIHYLPVTSEESCEVGSEVWGFPKVVRKMEIEERGSVKTCQLVDGKTEELRLEIEKIQVAKERERFSFCSYTAKEGKLLRTCIPALGSWSTRSMGAKASVTLRTGKAIEPLKKLDMSEKPAEVFFAERLESTLPPAQETFAA